MVAQNPSILLDLAASDEIESFKNAVQAGSPLNEPGLWYGARIGSRKMGLEKRTPLMIASLYGSTKVLSYILNSATSIDPNTTSGSDSASALHLAASGGSPSSPAAVQLLLKFNANPNFVTPNGLKPSDLISPNSLVSKKLNQLLGGELADPVSPKKDGFSFSGTPVLLPDINVGVYGSDEFRMYGFKIKPCSRAYTHDWTECPFAHPGENARRRDPIKNHYSCVPCPEFKKGSCRKGDECEFAHGVFESWLHPAQYKTRLCKDEIGCARKVCFFAHKKEELRPVYASTGSAVMDSGGMSQLSGGSRLRSSSMVSRVRSRKVAPSEFDGASPKSVVAAVLKSRIADRSQSFVDRGAVMGGGGFYAGWGAGDGRVDWSVQGEDLSKMRRSASFGIRGNVNVSANVGRFGFGGGAISMMEEPDVSWVSSLVRDVGAPPCAPWVDQVCT